MISSHAHDCIQKSVVLASSGMDKEVENNYVVFSFAAIKTVATSCLDFLQASVIILSLKKKNNQTLLRATGNGIIGILQR